MSEITCSIRPGSKVDACCDPKSSRYALGHCQVIQSSEPDQVHVAATDGKVLSVVTCGGKANRPALMPLKLVKPGSLAELNGRWECDGRVMPEGEGRFPRSSDALPDAAGCTVIALDIRLLAKLADALGGKDTGVVTLYVPANKPAKNGRVCDHVKEAVAVAGLHGIGAIMPCTPDHSPSDYETRRNAYAIAASKAQEIIHAQERLKREAERAAG